MRNTVHAMIGLVGSRSIVSRDLLLATFVAKAQEINIDNADCCLPHNGIRHLSSEWQNYTALQQITLLPC